MTMATEGLFMTIKYTTWLDRLALLFVKKRVQSEVCRMKNGREVEVTVATKYRKGVVYVVGTAVRPIKPLKMKVVEAEEDDER